MGSQEDECNSGQRGKSIIEHFVRICTMSHCRGPTIHWQMSAFCARFYRRPLCIPLPPSRAECSLLPCSRLALWDWQRRLRPRVGQRSRYASSCLSRPVARRIRWHASWRKSSESNSGEASSWRTRRARAPPSEPPRSRNLHLTATHCCSRPRPLRSRSLCMPSCLMTARRT